MHVTDDAVCTAFAADILSAFDITIDGAPGVSGTVLVRAMLIVSPGLTCKVGDSMPSER